MQYFDKDGREIKAGMKLLMEDGSIEMVYDTVDSYGKADLGINASNETFLDTHPNWARECYSLDDTEAFTPIVSAGIRQYEKEQSEYEEIQYTIKGRIMDYSDCTIDVRTVQGDIRLTPGDIKDLLDNEFEHIRIGDETIPAKDFLMQDADRIQRDLFNPSVYRLITNEAFEMQEHPIEYSEPTANDSQQM